MIRSSRHVPKGFFKPLRDLGIDLLPLLSHSLQMPDCPAAHPLKAVYSGVVGGQPLGGGLVDLLQLAIDEAGLQPVIR